MVTLNPEELLTVEQIAQMMQVNPRTIRNRINAGLLPARKMVGGKDWRIRRVDADALFSQGALRHAEQPAIIDRLSTPEGRARAVAALRSLREGDVAEQQETLALLQKAEREQPLSFRSWDDDDVAMLTGSAE
jgi:excisionase family DNA binding protein